MSAGKQHILDMRHGRQGGRIIPFEGRPQSAGRPCAACGLPMIAGQRDRHHVCDPQSIVGTSCTCPPRCTTGDVWGDGPRPCAAECAPCRIMAGKRLREIS